ncbi:MAG: acyl carrier protein [Pirellulaceae bacterium]
MSKLTALIEELLEEPGATIGEDTEFRDLPEWDSLKHVRLVVGLQAAYGIELDRDEIQQLTSLSEIRRVLAGRGELHGSPS